MRILKRLLAGLAVLIVVLVAGVWGVSSVKLSQKVTVRDTPVTIPTDSASIARGKYLAGPIGKCVECHAEDLGGKLAFDAGPVGRAVGANLTRGQGGVGAVYDDDDYVRAIRHGVDGAGFKLLAMPAEQFQYFANSDVGALVAYIRSVPPVDRTLERSQLKPLGRALYVAGVIKALVPADIVDHDRTYPPTPPTEGTIEYGEYLAKVGGCTGCHGPGLSGGRVAGTPPEFPPASNLTPEGIGHYSEQDFFRALREGIRPSGTPIDTLMPWKLTARMTDTDISTLFAYLKTVPRKPFGNR